MNPRSARRRPLPGGGPTPELVAAVLVAALYGAGLLLGPSILAGDAVPRRTETPQPSAPSASPVASANPLRADIAAVLEVDARLTQNGEDLRAILARATFRGSEVAFTLRRIKTTLQPGIVRVGRLAASPASREIGTQLELLYANASATVDRASGLALGSDLAYGLAAQEVIDLFTDLPGIDARLEALLAPTASPTAVPSASPTATSSSGPSAPPGSEPPPATAIPSLHPEERLRDPGFEMGLGSWSLRSASSGATATVRAAAPLGPVGTRSLEVGLPEGGSAAFIGVGQGPIALEADARYVATVSIRSDGPRSAQLRVVGPAEETYGITIVDIGPATVVAKLEFVAVLDEPWATFWIDLSGSTGGTVWLDDASLVQQAP